MIVKHFVIHAITKAKGSNKVVLRERDAELVVDPMVSRFVEAAFELFNRQNKGLLFAGFEGEGSLAVFRNYLSAFNTQHRISFLEFSVNSVRHLAETMTAVNFATGGFVILAQGEIEGEERLCVLLLSQEHKFAIEEMDLTLRDVPTLDLERMGVGCFVSLTKWAAAEAEPVAFVRGNREVSEYFMRFIGARPTKTPKQASREITVYAQNFLTNHNIVGPQQTDRLKRMYDYCVVQFKARQPVDLNVVGSIVYQEEPATFCLDANKAGISSEFHVEAAHLKNLLEIQYITNGLSLKISRSTVREKLQVSMERRELTIREVDEKTLAEIEEALGNGQS